MYIAKRKRLHNLTSDQGPVVRPPTGRLDVRARNLGEFPGKFPAVMRKRCYRVKE